MAKIWIICSKKSIIGNNLGVRQTSIFACEYKNGVENYRNALWVNFKLAGLHNYLLEYFHELNSLQNQTNGNILRQWKIRVEREKLHNNPFIHYMITETWCWDESLSDVVVVFVTN